MKKTYTNLHNKTVEITDLEYKVIYFLKCYHVMEDCYTSDVEDISNNIAVSLKVLRGVISSLIKKDIGYMMDVAHDNVDWFLLWEEKEYEIDESSRDQVQSIKYKNKNTKIFEYSFEEIKNFYLSNHKSILDIYVDYHSYTGLSNIEIYMNDNTIRTIVNCYQEKLFQLLYFFDLHGQKYTAT